MTSWTQRLLAPYREGLAGIDRRAYIVVTITMLSVASRMSVYTFLGIYLTREVGFSLTLVGIAFLAENILRGAVAPIAGAFSDRIGRRPVIIGSAILIAMVVPLFLFVHTPLQLILWSLALGATQAGMWPATSALLLDLAPPEKRQAALSLNYTAISIGYTAGVAPAGFLLLFGFPALAAASALGFALIAVIAFVLLRGPLPATHAEGARASILFDAAVALRDPAFRFLALLGAIFPLGIGLIASVAPLYAKDAGVTEAAIGLALAINGPLLAIFSIPVAARLGRDDPYRYLAFAAVFLALSYIAFIVSGGLAALIVASIVFTLGELIFSSALPTAVASLAPPGRRGAYQGSWAMVFSMGTGAAVALTGALRIGLGWPWTWAAWAAFTVAAALGLAAARGRFVRVAAERNAQTAAAK